MSEHHDDIAARLRASLADQARRAPDGGPLGEQILASVAHAPPPRRPLAEHSRWRTWGLPLVAAAAVAAVIGAAIGITHLSGDADHAPPAHQTGSRPATVTSLPHSPSTTGAQSGTPSASPPTQPAHEYALTKLVIRDLSFVGENEGWALGTANCLTGGGTCTALAHSSDGTHWTGRGTTPFNVPGVQDCAAPCVTNIRFATEDIGYAYGPDALFMTTDAAATWQRMAGGAAALETLNGDVVRVLPVPAGCGQPGCTYAVQTAAIGSASWHPASLRNATTSGMSTGVQLSRTASVAVLAVFGHPAGGASSAVSAVYTSTNNGVSWFNRGEPCQGSATGGGQPENDTIAVATAPDHSITLLCQRRGDGSESTISSTDAGATWGPSVAGSVKYASGIAATSAHNLVVVADHSIWHSVDGGASWQNVFSAGGLPTLVVIGFETQTTGRILQLPSVEGAGAILTTHDAGASWTPTHLP
jgi:hypothetical protein